MHSATRAHTVPRFYLNGFVAPESETSRDPYVWFASLTTGQVKRRSPKNISISRGLYDGPGGFDESGVTIEAHLAKIEDRACRALRKLSDDTSAHETEIPAEIWRLLAWQAARTPGCIALEEDWIYHWNATEPVETVEPPPEGLTEIRNRARKLLLEHPDTGEQRDVYESRTFEALAAMAGNGCFRQRTSSN